MCSSNLFIRFGALVHGILSLLANVRPHPKDHRPHGRHGVPFKGHYPTVFQRGHSNLYTRQQCSRVLRHRIFKNHIFNTEKDKELKKIPSL